MRFLRALDRTPAEAHFTWNGVWLPDEAAALLDAAGILAIAIVIQNAFHPDAPGCAVITVGKNGRILDRDVELIVVAIGHPAANLLDAGFTRIQHHIERVMNVIRTALFTQLLFEFLLGP